MKLIDIFIPPKSLSRADRIQFILSRLIKASLFLAFVLSVLSANWTTAFVAILTFIATVIPTIISKNYNIRLPIGFEFLIVLFLYATLFLGEVRDFYFKFWWWDIALHTGAGLAFGFIGFLLLYSFYRAGKFGAPAIVIAVLAFCVSMAIGALWEIFEFSMDQLFGMNMQKSGLVDTMWDLIVNTIGALIASVSGYFYMRYDREGLGIFKYYVESFFEPDGRAKIHGNQ